MMEAKPIFLISATAEGVTLPAQATVVSTRARFVMPGTVSLVTCASARPIRTNTPTKADANFIEPPLNAMSERVASLLGSAHRDDSSRNHVRIAKCVRDQLFVNFIGLGVVRRRNRSSKPARREPADRQVTAALNNAVQRDAAIGERCSVARRVV